MRDTVLDKGEKQILDLLPKGMEKPISLRELVKLTGLQARAIRATIYRLIVIHHQPIGAIHQHPNNGYFIITNDTERGQALAPVVSQIKMMMKKAKTLRTIDLEEK